MRAALLLIDLQRDFLDRPGLAPAEEALLPRIAELLEICRRHRLPILRSVTRVRADGSNRMPHWRAQDTWACVEGTPGADTPDSVAARPDEPEFDKSFYSAFGNPLLDATLNAERIDTLIVAGLYTHACIRASVLDAYGRGYRVWLAADAVASCEPAHAQQSLSWLEGRAASCRSVAQIADALTMPEHISTPQHAVWLHRNPCNWQEVLAEVPLADAREVQTAVQQAERRVSYCALQGQAQRLERLRRWHRSLLSLRERAIHLLVREVAKPVTEAAAEFDYALALLRHTIDQLDNAPVSHDDDFEVRFAPHGVVALITPWNNPLALAVGKLSPALACGNTVLWKPALPTLQISRLVMETLFEAELGEDVCLLSGDAETARLLLAHEAVRAVSFTGSIAAGREVALLCGQRGQALQAELGGNNAVLVMADVDVEAVARQLAPAIFSFAGQRCTAPRRIIVEHAVERRFIDALVVAVAQLRLGDPRDTQVRIGPLISREQQQRMAQLTQRGLAAGGKLLCGGSAPPALKQGCWFEPTLIAGADPQSEIVQQESFGPVAVVNEVHDLERALQLCNAVPQGLVASLFSNDEALQQRFLERAQAGILTINRTALPIAVDAPFGGWKQSGLGIPEHGRWDLEFYRRPQARYGL